jgi:tetratricopeptide (TPR) repeat protein
MGFVLGVAAAVAAALGIVSALRRLPVLERNAAVALAGLPAAYVIHALVDYDLDFIAATAPMLVVVGALLASGRPAAPTQGGRAAALGVGVVALAVIAVLVTPALAERDVERSTVLLEEGRVAAAARAADRARTLDPLSLDPVYAAAAVAEERGDRVAAEAFYRRATELQPENPEPWLFLGLYEYTVSGDLCAAYAALNAAYTLDPNGRWQAGGPLDVAREAVNEGACERRL